MVVVLGVTYRLERTGPHAYSVVRLLDDVEVGTFRTLPALRVHPLKIEVNILRDIVRAALRSARTSATMHAAPVFQPDDERAVSSAPPPSHRVASSAPPPQRVASSAPPPTPVMA